MFNILTTEDYLALRDFPKFEGIVRLIAEYQENKIDEIIFPNSSISVEPIVLNGVIDWLESEPRFFTVESNSIGLPATHARITKINWATMARTRISFYATAQLAGATGVQTAINLTRSIGTNATSTGTSFAIPAGKTFRIQQLIFGTRGHNTATAQVTTFNLRVNTAGAVTTTSTPVLLSIRSATPSQANAWDRVIVPIDASFDITGGATLQFGVTAASVFTTNAPTWDVTIIGYEI